LDSFAGSGTTGQAVLTLNKEDHGSRRFILVEMEDYADKLTAERLRRVIAGVKTAKSEGLKEGLGGTFTFCELGQEINVESLLKGENMPEYEALARYVFYTATGKTLEKVAKANPEWFVGETDLFKIHLIYRPDLDFLRSADAALNSDLVEKLTGGNGSRASKRTLVFANAKFMSQKELTDRGIQFCQLPYAIHRIMGD
jgi:adenine-specific DNA-methyltransferase